MPYKSFSIGSRKIDLMDYPAECPECHQKTTPIYNSHRLTKDGLKLYAFVTCPNHQCDKSYVAEYLKNSGIFSFNEIIIGTPKNEIFPIEIEALSPTFIKVYNESFFAEQLGLLEISGVGFRKALEFLIKDYLVRRMPEKEHIIKEMPLGKCISELVDDLRIKESAVRAAWLGNDQTHYVKKWEDMELKDLKRLLKLTVNWVESELLTSELNNIMPE